MIMPSHCSLRLRELWIWVLICLCFIATSGIAIAQTAAGSGPATMMASDAHPVFEVAAIKRGDPSSRNGALRLGGRHVRLENQTVEWMTAFAFGVQKEQIVGAPDWVSTERFDVDGVPDVEGQPNMNQLQGMLQNLLTDRFGLKMHREQREMGVYAVRIANGGPRLKRSLGDPNGVPNQTGGGKGHMKFTNNSMAEFALGMQFFLDRPVVDRTGLEGRWDFELTWTPDETRVTDPNAPPGLFTAVQEQLGLKLEPVKAPADVLVVDAVEKPSAN
jgi:uncharacterized protein (TIGR03435 family)